MRGRVRKVGEEEVAQELRCRGAAARAQTKEQNPSKWKMSQKEQVPEQHQGFSG